MKTITTTREFVSGRNELYELLKKELKQSVVDFVDDNLDKDVAEYTVDLLKKKYPEAVRTIERQSKDIGDRKIEYIGDDGLKKEVSEYITILLNQQYQRLIEALACGQEGGKEENAKEKAPYHYGRLKLYLKGVSSRRILHTQDTIEKCKRLVTLFLRQEHIERYPESHEIGLSKD